jgi:hypothetical protein
MSLLSALLHNFRHKLDQDQWFLERFNGLFAVFQWRVGQNGSNPVFAENFLTGCGLHHRSRDKKMQTMGSNSLSFPLLIMAWLV